MAKFSSKHDTATAKILATTTPFVALDGPTNNNRDWILLKGGAFDSVTRIWKLPIPTNPAATAALLHDLTSRGMRWKAVKR